MHVGTNEPTIPPAVTQTAENFQVFNQVASSCSGYVWISVEAKTVLANSAIKASMPILIFILFII